jgi:hypothetical protein
MTTKALENVVMTYLMWECQSQNQNDFYDKLKIDHSGKAP